MNDIIFYSVAMITFVFVTSTIVFLVIYGYKSRRRILRGRTYLGLKRAKVTFKFFNTSVSQAFLVRRNVPYDVIYKLETEQGKVRFSLGQQFYKETTSRIEGSTTFIFSRRQPVVYIEGVDAVNGSCEVKLYKKSS